MSETTQIWHIDTGDDGRSRMEPISLSMAPSGNGAVRKLLAGPGVMIRRIPADGTPEWHTAPRRQLIATIVGEGEIETGDGQTLIVRPGVVTVVEDLEGIGHLTHGRGTQDRICVFAPLDAATELA